MTGPDGERLCSNCGEPNPVRAKFCLECGAPLASGAQPSKPDLVDQLPQESSSSGERRNVTVIFADLSGFTAYSEGSDVEDVRAIAQETAQRLGEIVERYGGTVDKIIGDCVMAVFGAPTAHEDDAERAVRAALDMQACVAENRERFAGLTLCVGVQTGEAMWAPVGPDRRYTVLGDTVNTAARIQGAAGKGEIYIGQPTHHAVADVIECEPLEPIKAKNKAEPVPVWRAVSVKGQRSAHKPVVAKLAGRDAELTRLREAWEVIRTQKRPSAVTVLGSAGVGKTRLVNTLTNRVGDTALILRGRCLAYGEGITYWPVIEIIRQVAEIHNDDDRATVSTKLDALLESLGSTDLDELRTMAVALSNLIGAPATPRGTYTATSISRGELHWGVRRILELGSRILPLVVVFEDMHWAEPTLLELIEFIFESTESAPILGILTARPEFEERNAEFLKPRRNRRVIELESLSDDAAAALVNELIGEDLPDELVAQILRSAGGNPLFLEEIAQMWRDARSRGDTALTSSEIPGGLQALIDSRLDTLSATERRLISVAAVVGDTFWRGSIETLEANGTDLDTVLDILEERDLIRMNPSSSVSGEREFTFKHGLIREAAYRRLTKTERALLHERCGGWIAGLPGGEDEFAEIIAYHLEQACRISSDLNLSASASPMIPAAHALFRASERAEAREGIREAERFLARAIELLGDGFPETTLPHRLRRSRLLSALTRYEEARVAAHEAAQGASGLGLVEVACSAHRTLAEIDTHFGRSSDAHKHIEEAERLARETKDPRSRIQTMFVRAYIQDQLDAQRAEVVDMLRTAIALAEEVNEADLIREGRLRLGVLSFNAGDLEQADVQFERSLALARDEGSLRIQSWASAYLGRVRYNRGPREDADELLEQAQEWMARTNDRYMQVWTLIWMAQLALSREDAVRALGFLRTAEPIVTEFGGALMLDFARCLAEVLFRQGRTSEVMDAVPAAIAAVPDEHPVARANGAIVEAFGAAAAGDGPGARRHYAQALAILESSSTADDIGEARISYARLLEHFGDRTGAEMQLDKAREAFAKLGAHASVAQVDGELARLRDLKVGRGASAPVPGA